MKNFRFFGLMAFAMVIAAATMLSSCKKENVYDFVNVQATEVSPADPIIIIDSTVIDTTGGRKIIVVDYHNNYGQWVVSGNTATISATHTIKQIAVPDGGASYVVDSVCFNEVGTMSWSFPNYDHSVDGNYGATESGCSDLSATCTLEWVYNVPEEYAPYFEGHCELVPTTVKINGTTATVNTTNGTTSRPANFSITVNGGDPTVVSRSAYWRHMHDCGQWTGAGATRTISGHCWCVETTKWSDGSTTKDSVLVAWNGIMSWSFPTYTQNMDGTYSANANGCTGLQATASVSYNYGVANIQGRTYTHGAACGPVPSAITVNGTTATVTTNSPLREAVYSLTIVTPPTQDTVKLDGQMAYYFESDAYYTSYTSYVRRYGFIVMTDGRVYKTLRKISPLSNVAGGNWYTPSFALCAQTLTTSEMSVLPGQINAGNALALWFEHTSDDGIASNDNAVSDGSHASVLSIVSYDGQIHYWHVVSTSAMNFAHWYGDITLVGTTVSGTSVVNPVHAASACTSVTINGVVYTGTNN